MFVNKFRPMFLYNPEPGAGDPPAPPPPTGAAEDKKFTQADVDRIVGERATRAGEAATSKLLESLGVKDADEIKTALAEFKKLSEGQKSEIEKAIERATKAETALKAQAQETKRKELVANAKVAAVGLEFKADKINHVLKLVDITDESTDETIKAALEALAAEMPELLSKQGAPNTGATNPARGSGAGSETDAQRRDRLMGGGTFKDWMGQAAVEFNPNVNSKQRKPS